MDTVIKETEEHLLSFGISSISNRYNRRITFHEFGGNLEDGLVENSRSYCIWYVMSLTGLYIQLFGPSSILLFQSIQETLETLNFPEEMNMMSLAYISLGSLPCVFCLCLQTITKWRKSFFCTLPPCSLCDVFWQLHGMKHSWIETSRTMDQKKTCLLRLFSWEPSKW